MLKLSIRAGLLFYLLFLVVFPKIGLSKDAWKIQARVAWVDHASKEFILRDISTVSGELPFEKVEIRVRVHPGDAQVGYADQRIRAHLVEDEVGWRLEYVWPADSDKLQQMEDVNRRLRFDTVTRGRKVYRAMGEYLPDFALFDQNGNAIRHTTFRGKRMVLNFFFTRCMIPKMCPAATARLVRLQREAKKKQIDGFQIISISFDPEYDTPGVLNDYGTQRGIDFGNYSLLTGDKQAIEDMMKQFGILVFPEDGTLNHTMATLLIDEKGKILYRKNGSRWSVRDFLDRLSKS